MQAAAASKHLSAALAGCCKATAASGARMHRKPPSPSFEAVAGHRTGQCGASLIWACAPVPTRWGCALMTTPQRLPEASSDPFLARSEPAFAAVVAWARDLLERCRPCFAPDAMAAPLPDVVQHMQQKSDARTCWTKPSAAAGRTHPLRLPGIACATALATAGTTCGIPCTAVKAHGG